MNRFFENHFSKYLFSERVAIPIALGVVVLLAAVLLVILLVSQYGPPGKSIALFGGTAEPTATSLRRPTFTPWAAQEASQSTVTATSVPTEPAFSLQEAAESGTSLPPSPTSTPTPPSITSTPEGMAEVRAPYLGIWISAAELAQLPTSGPAWEHLKAAAERELREPKVRNKDESNNTYILAKALVYARTGESGYREEIVDNLMDAIGTEDGGRTLAVSRNLLAYVLAADLVNLPADPEKDEKFREWLRDTLSERLDGLTLRSTHELRPNNWGTHAGASRVAVALYLQDDDELERAARVFKGWLGDREAYADFDYGDLHWQADPDKPVGINPKGATKEGHSIDGAQPEEMRRGGKFRWPPKRTNYPWGGLQGALVQAEMLCRAGYPAWEWEDSALLRAVEFLYEIEWPPTGDDEWQPWLVNYAYGTDFPAPVTTRPGKNMGWTDWTHSESRPPRGQQGGC